MFNPIDCLFLIPFLSCFVLASFLLAFVGRDLQGNKLTGQIPDEIGNCVLLELM